MVEGTEKDKQRAEMFDALGHPTRIKLLKVLSEGPLGFSDLKRSLNIDSGGHLNHHLDKLGDLIKKDEYGKYCISDKGKDALLSLQPVEKYNEDARFKEQTGLLIRALRSENKSVQGIAIVQLSLFGPKVVPLLRAALLEAIADSKRLEGKYSHSYYNGDSRLSDAPERAVTGIVQIMGIIGTPNVVQDIVETLPRTEAFEALAKIGNKQALDSVVAFIPEWYSKNGYWEFYDENDVSESTMRKIVEVDGFLRRIFNSFDEEGRIALEAALTAENFGGKNAIARILATVGDDKSIPSLITALETGDFAIKKESAGALKRLKAVDAMPKMIEEFLRTATSLETARKQRGYWSNDDTPAKDACEVYVKAILALGSTDDWIKIAFYRPRIEGYAEQFDRAIITAKEKVVPALTKLLEAPDKSVQIAATEMLLRIKRGDRNDDDDDY